MSTHYDASSDCPCVCHQSQMTRCTTAAANCAKPGTPEKRSGHALRSKPNLYVQLKQTDPLQCFRSLTNIPNPGDPNPLVC